MAICRYDITRTRSHNLVGQTTETEPLDRGRFRLLTASLTELRDPKRVIENAGDKPVAILNRNQLEGYFVPAAAGEKISFSVADPEDVSNLLRKRQSKLKPTLDYLKDK